MLSGDIFRRLDDELRNILMGHSVDRPKYGSGGSLKLYQEEMMKIVFALQILQRRLASSPAAIHRSLERRRKRLEERLREEKLMRQTGAAPLSHAPILPVYDPDDIDEVPGNEAEEAEEQIVDQATAAATLAELEAEIVILRDLEERALRLKLSGQVAKWRELESILDEPLMLDSTTGLRRKVIIFTEPKDTLEYLQQKITARV
jgi:hypothetical protein